MEAVHPRSIGKYEVLGILGKGGMGVVYKARDPLIDRTVAIKTILSKEEGEAEQLLTRLRMEAKSAGRLQHPNIVTIYDFGHQDALTFLVMEYVEGSNLARVIESGVDLPLNTKIDIVVQLCDGLAYAHDLGVVHRDIKPANICLTKRFDPKILDFGLARFDETRLTRTGLVSGTISYMSPERLTGESGPSDDIFALGAVAYEIFTGRRAFPGKNMAEVVNNIRSGHYPIPASEVVDIPSGIDTVIARATAPDKSKRYASASEFGKALREVQYSETFQRRAATEKSSPVDALKTVAIQLTGENPYTAPEMDAATVERPKETAAPYRTVEAPKLQQPSQKQPAQPATEQFSGVHFAKTELGLTAGAIRAGESKKPEPLDGTELHTIPAERKSILDRTRTVVARMRGKKAAPQTERFHAEPQVAAVTEAVPKQVRHGSPLKFWIAATALFVAVGALGFAAASGTKPLLITYAAAVGAWLLLVREGESVSLRTIAFIALPLHVVALFQAPLSGALLDRELAIGRALIQSGSAGADAAAAPPVASLMLALWAAVGGLLAVRRALMIVAALTAAWLVWQPHKSRRTLAVATFPLLILEGTINARLEVVAMALLVAAIAALARKRDGLTALCAVLACGIATTSVVALPVLYNAAWQMFIFLFSALIAAFLPRLFLPAAGTWSSSMAVMVAGSPVLTFLTKRVEDLLHQRGVTEGINRVLRAIAKRAEIAPSIVSEPAFAAVIVVVIVLIVIAVIAQRAGTTEGAIADAVGLMLLVCVTRDPAAWLLVVPFAIAGNRRLWLFIAACSPLLLIGTEGTTGWLVYAASLLLPAAGFVGLKLQEVASETSAPAAARA